MFESLSARLQSVFKSIRGEIRLTPEGVESALREIRLALLEADVNFKVVKAFIDRVRDRSVDEQVLKSLTPAQHVVRIVRDEMLALFGVAEGRLSAVDGSPGVILLLGLQGSGKTTTAAKLGRWLSRQNRHPLLVSTDIRRPAAVEQLRVLSAQAGLRSFEPDGVTDPVARATHAVTEARHLGFDVVVVDTAGRLHIDDELMLELQSLKAAVHPNDLLYVADAMTGQDAIKSAGEFNRRVGVSGVILTKIDGDARGGAALSVVSVVGVPITFVGSGERLDDLEAFQATRIVSRLLGMGDVLSLVEKAERVITQEEAVRLEEKIRRNDFTLEDFRNQLQAVRRMGPLEQLMGLMPGLGGVAPGGEPVDSKQLARVEAIISSMTPRERRHRHIIDGSRRRRIACGSGTTVQEVNRLLKQFVQMQRLLKNVGTLGRGQSGKRFGRGSRALKAQLDSLIR